MYPLKNRIVIKGEETVAEDSLIFTMHLRKLWVVVKFPYDNNSRTFRNTLVKIKSLPNRQYSKKHTVWKIPCDLMILNDLLGLLPDFPISAGFVKVYNGLVSKEIEQRKRGRELDKIQKDFKVDLKIDLKEKLFPFQKAGVAFMNAAEGKVLLADEMGLGKTVQAIAYCQQHNLTVLIVCPAGAKYVWDGEIAKFTDRTVSMLDKKTIGAKADFTVTSYASVNKYTEDLLKQKFDCIILDEAHYIKNSKTIRAKETHKLSVIESKLLLTGTPILNRPKELFSLLQFLYPDEYTSYWDFARKYCGLKRVTFRKKDGFDKAGNQKYKRVSFWDDKGSSNLYELHRLLKTVMIRREKTEVDLEMPPKLYSDILIDLPREAKKEYNRAYEDFIGYLKEQRRLPSEDRHSAAIHLTKLTELKQILSRHKMGFVEEFIGNLGDSKVLIFSQYLQPLYALLDQYKDSSIIMTGKDSSKAKKAKEVRFQTEKDLTIFLGSVQAAGTHWTLTAANKVLFINPLWTPADHDQAADRAHRIGQKNCVNVYTPIFKGTIEEDIVELLNKKRIVIRKTMKGRVSEEENKKIKKEIYRDFMRKIKQREKIDI